LSNPPTNPNTHAEKNEAYRRATIDRGGERLLLGPDRAAAAGARQGRGRGRERGPPRRRPPFAPVRACSSETTASRVELSRRDAMRRLRPASEAVARTMTAFSPTPATAESRLWRSCASPNVHVRRRASSTKGCNPPPPWHPEGCGVPPWRAAPTYAVMTLLVLGDAAAAPHNYEGRVDARNRGSAGGRTCPASTRRWTPAARCVPRAAR
jgi:hypothetical protein